MLGTKVVSYAYAKEHGVGLYVGSRQGLGFVLCLSRNDVEKLHQCPVCFNLSYDVVTTCGKFKAEPG